MNKNLKFIIKNLIKEILEKNISSDQANNILHDLTYETLTFGKIIELLGENPQEKLDEVWSAVSRIAIIEDFIKKKTILDYEQIKNFIKFYYRMHFINDYEIALINKEEDFDLDIDFLKNALKEFSFLSEEDYKHLQYDSRGKYAINLILTKIKTTFPRIMLSDLKFKR